MDGVWNIGVAGCGMVSHAYLGTIARSPKLRLRALASRTSISAIRQAAHYGGQAVSIDAMLADPEVAIIVNLAPPSEHHEIGQRVLRAGKHLYCEKPFATNLDDAHDLLSLAEARGLAIGCAPDTFLGEGQQTVRRLVDDNSIGTIVGGAAAFGTSGMEAWHPNPAAFYAAGGGPLLDIGPYYITQLINLLGPVAEVTAIGTCARATRTITSTGREGETIDVAVPTNVNGALLFASGANVSVSMSWDVVAHGRSAIELYGTTGSILAPDPNRFKGSARLSDGKGAWTIIGAPDETAPVDPSMLARAVQALSRGIDPATGDEVGPDTALRFGDLRGLGLLDLVSGLEDSRPPRASGQLATHVLEVLLGLEQSARDGSRVVIGSRVPRPQCCGA